MGNEKITAQFEQDYLCDVAKRSVPEFSSGKWDFISCHLAQKEEHHKNAILRYEISYRDENGSVIDDLVAKRYPKRWLRRSHQTHHIIKCLWDAGFKPPSPHRVPRLYGFSEEEGVLFMEEVSGLSWRDLILAGEERLTKSSRTAAEWLFQLHTSKVDFHKSNPHAAVIRLRRFGRELAPLFKRQAPRLQRTLQTIIDEVGKQSDLVPCHGDFHARHIYMTPEFATGIDLDTLGLREAEFDVGYAIGHALMMSWYGSGNFASGVRVSEIFLRQYEEHRQLQWPRLRLHIARSVFQSAHYGIMMLNPRMTAIEPWLDLTDHYLTMPAPELAVSQEMTSTLQSMWEHPQERVKPKR